MKFACFIIMILIIFACSDRKTNFLSEKIAGIDKPLSENESKILKDVQKECMGYFTFRSEDIDEPFKTLLEIDTFQLSVSPAYELDIASFYADPSPEMLLSCLSPLENQMWYVGRGANGKTVRLDLLKEGGKWRVSGSIDDFGRVISWLPSKLAQADSKKYMEFNVFGNEYIVYFKDDKPVFHRITGMEISADKLCEYIVESVNATRENLKGISGSFK